MAARSCLILLLLFCAYLTLSTEEEIQENVKDLKRTIRSPRGGGGGGHGGGGGGHGGFGGGHGGFGGGRGGFGGGRGGFGGGRGGFGGGRGGFGGGRGGGRYGGGGFIVPPSTFRRRFYGGYPGYFYYCNPWIYPCFP